jgi:tetratricopeptide (TPR) repeat protein
VSAEPRIRIAVASPGDVLAEREALARVVDELNRGVADGRLALWRWETDARPGLHRDGPQGLIDELMDLQGADIVVGVFWKRLGVGGRDGGSGTEHELRKAWQAWRRHGRPDVMLYFCDRPHTPTTSPDAVQWASVLAFRAQLPEEQLCWTYTTPLDFERLLREHLTRWLRHVPPPAGVSGRLDRASSGRAHFNVPPVAASFVGRERELAQLDAALRGTDRAVVTQAITGPGGVGKSQLAARYAEQHAGDYDIVAWIGADDGGIADLADLAARLGVARPGLAPGELAQLALDHLATTSRTWLLVLDDVQSPERLAQLRPRGGEGRVLVTSRDRGLRQYGPLVTVDVFDESTATAYLAERADRPDDVRAARQLARALGCLPLALSHAAAYCWLGTSFADYQQLLEGLPVRELFDSHPDLSYAQTVASTWKPSIDAATLMAPLASDVIEMAAYLAPDAIPKSMFASLGGDGSTAQRKRVADALNALSRYSLATVDDEAISMHKLLQKVVRDDASARSVPTAGLRALAAIDDSFPQHPDLPGHWPACERLLSHARAIAETLCEPGDESVRLIRLLNRACRYLNSSEPGGRGLTVARDVLARAERVPGPEHPATLDTRGHLARAYQSAGRIADALAIYEPLASIRERIQGAEHPDTLRTRRHLADAYQWHGRAGDAIAIYEQLVTIAARTLGEEHPDTLTTRHSLAHAYLLTLRTADALAICEPLAAMRTRILGAEHPDTLLTRQVVGLAYTWDNQPERAIAILEPLLADRTRILGAEHVDTLGTRQILGLAYRCGGRPSHAVAVFEALLADSSRLRGEDHPQTLNVRHHLADAQLAAGCIGDAIVAFAALLADCRRVLGPDAPHTLSTRNSLEVAYRAAGDADRVRA